MDRMDAYRNSLSEKLLQGLGKSGIIMSSLSEEKTVCVMTQKKNRILLDYL